MMDTLEIRPVEASDLDVLAERFDSEFGRTHADDLQDQIAGDKTFFVAWLGLGTDPEIPVSSNLYCKLGYGDVPDGLFDDIYKRRNEDGSVVTIKVKARFLVKELHCADGTCFRTT